MIPVYLELSVSDLPTAPRGLLYLSAFSRRNRDVIASNAELREELRAAAPGEW